MTANTETLVQLVCNPNAGLITSVTSGYQVEEIENPLMQQVRYLHKLVDELANSRKMEKITCRVV
ncbi:MAG: DUF2200 family protein [Chitinophagaceae bacterium]